MKRTGWTQKERVSVCHADAYPLYYWISAFSVYSSTAAWAAARRCWVSVTYRVSVKYWHLFLDSFCSFCLIFQGKNGSMADSFSFLDFIFIIFYTRLLDFSLTIVNCKCFVSPEDWTSWTNTTFCLQKYKIILNSGSFFSFFVQNEFDFNMSSRSHS